MYKHKANQLKKEDKISLQWSVSSPMNHWYLNSAYSLKKRGKKGKQASKALQHYYVHSSSGERESWCHDEGKGRETETPVKQESFLAQRLEL